MRPDTRHRNTQTQTHQLTWTFKHSFRQNKKVYYWTSVTIMPWFHPQILLNISQVFYIQSLGPTILSVLGDPMVGQPFFHLILSMHTTLPGDSVFTAPNIQEWKIIHQSPPSLTTEQWPGPTNVVFTPFYQKHTLMIPNMMNMNNLHLVVGNPVGFKDRKLLLDEGSCGTLGLGNSDIVVGVRIPSAGVEQIVIALNRFTFLNPRIIYIGW